MLKKSKMPYFFIIIFALYFETKGADAYVGAAKPHAYSTLCSRAPTGPIDHWPSRSSDSPVRTDAGERRGIHPPRCVLVRKAHHTSLYRPGDVATD
jgi:hypothetical protein